MKCPKPRGCRSSCSQIIHQGGITNGRLISIQFQDQPFCSTEAMGQHEGRPGAGKKDRAEDNPFRERGLSGAGFLYAWSRSRSYSSGAQGRVRQVRPGSGTARAESGHSRRDDEGGEKDKTWRGHRNRGRKARPYNVSPHVPRRGGRGYIPEPRLSARRGMGQIRESEDQPHPSYQTRLAVRLGKARKDDHSSNEAADHQYPAETERTPRWKPRRDRRALLQVSEPHGHLGWNLLARYLR